jgi:serine/threonine protein phosphatase PrpC
MILNFLKRLFRPTNDRLILSGRTDTGRIRANNEDSFTILPKARLMMVADGMGGHKAGEVASRVSIETMVRLLDREVLEQAGDNQTAIRHLLIQALRQTNGHIMAMAQENTAYSGMGSTFILGFISRGRLHTCHVGDVRAYLLSGAKLSQLTNDHTYAAEFERTQRLDPNHEQTSRTMNRNIVSRAIGFPFPEDPEYTTTPLAVGDRILLCSDGLWSMLPDPELATILQQAATPEEACDRLISAANRAGGKDNITAVVGFI